MSLVFAVVAAFANALNVVAQHVASTSAPATDKGWRLARYLVRSPLWLLGAGATLASFVFQALALYRGRVSVVQAVLVSELIFSLVIGRLWLRRTVTGAAWASGSVTCAGLVVFLVMSEPQGGHDTPTTGAWIPAVAATGGLAALLALLAGRGSGPRRGALYASASGTVWALMASFLKSAGNVLAGSGFLAMLTHPAVYAVVAAGVVGTVLTQAAQHYGPLSVSQPLMVIVDPVVSIILGVWLYGEQFTPAPLRLAAATVGFTAMALGVVFLSRTAPSFEVPEAGAAP